MTYYSNNIWWHQDLSNAAPGFKVIQKVIFMLKNWKNLGIKFLISFVKCMGFVGQVNGMGKL